MLKEVSDKYGYSDAFGDKIPTYVFGGWSGSFGDEYCPEVLDVASDIDDKTRGVLYRIMENGGLTMMSLMAALRPDRLTDFVRSSPDGKRIFVDGDRFLPTLTKEEIIEWCGKSEQAAYIYVKNLINVADREDARDVLQHYSGSISTK